jgi:hypothetical protein
MINTVFVPVTCATCNRTSAIELSVSELKPKLDAGTDIELRCAYDDVTWNASAKERTRISKLCQENALLSERSWLRLHDRASRSISI